MNDGREEQNKMERQRSVENPERKSNRRWEEEMPSAPTMPVEQRERIQFRTSVNDDEKKKIYNNCPPGLFRNTTFIFHTYVLTLISNENIIPDRP